MKKIDRILIRIAVLVMAAAVSLNAGDRNKSQSFKNFLVNNHQEDTTPEQKLMSRAFFLSLALPGMGQLYTGNLKSAKIFWAAEAVLWTTFGTFRAYGLQKRYDYRMFAAAHADINTTGKDHKYFVAVENYMTIRDYNNDKLRQRNIAAMYPEDSFHSWQWDDEKSRNKFKSLRISSDRAFDRAVIVVGSIVLNHLISAIDGLREARKRSGENIVGIVGLPEGGGVVYFVKSF